MVFGIPSGKEHLEQFWQLFVGGIGEKSGTTWVQLMLDSHPNITCRGESNFPALLNHIGELKKRHDQISRSATHDYHRHGFTLPEQRLLNVWAAYVTNCMLPNISDATRFVIDKSPNNAAISPIILQSLPHSKVIVLHRDPRDIIASGWATETVNNPLWIKNTFDGKIEKYIESCLRNLEQRIGATNQAKTLFPDRVLLLSYENLVADVMSEVGKLLYFICGSTDELDAVIDAGSFEKLSGGRKSGTEDRKSFFRKGVVGDHRNILDERSIEMIEEWMEKSEYNATVN